MDTGWAFAALQGLGLAACAGLRTFLPLLVVGVAGRVGWLPLSPRFEWLADNPALIAFGVAVVIEVAADKIPIVDHALDFLQVWMKPIAGAMLAASVTADLTPLQATVLTVVAGAAVAPVVHIAKAKFRLATTALTGGLGNPLVSTAEDVGVVTASVASVFVPWLVLLAFAGMIAFWWRRRARSAARPG